MRVRKSPLHTDISELAVFEDHEIQLLSQFYQLLGQIPSKVFNDIDMGLQSGTNEKLRFFEWRGTRLALIMQQLFPTRLTTSSISSPFVTSTLTHRLVFLRSISSSSLTAAALFWYGTRAEYERCALLCEVEAGPVWELVFAAIL